MTAKPNIRRTISLPEAAWHMLDRFRFGRHIRRESDAVRMLLEAGYEALEGKPAHVDCAAQPDGDGRSSKKAAAGFPQRRPK